MIEYIISRLNETSTWRGVIALLTGVGVKIRPDLTEAIISAGMSAMGIINILRKEKKNDAVDSVAPKVS
jgi:hypothetical protein